MIKGVFCTWPWTFGGRGEDPEDVAAQAMLDAMAPVLDPTPDTPHEIETRAHAIAIAAIWQASSRMANQAIASKMLEALTMWEELLKLTPSPEDSENARRDVVASRLRGLKNNARPDIEDTARKVLRASFVEVVTPDPDNVVAYWPGGIPGPPGFEWTSTQAIVGIRMSKASMTDAQFYAKRAAVYQAMDALLPSWMKAVVGVGNEFTVNVSIVGQDFI